MIGGKSVLAIVPARGSSKRIPRKNLRILAGKSLLARAIESALGAATVDRTIVSSDDGEIISAAIAAGASVPFVRPTSLANDAASSADVVQHAIAHIDERFDLIVLVQPTSPLRHSSDIDRAVELCVHSGAPSVISITQSHESPFHQVTLEKSGRLRPIVTEIREESPLTYIMNGAVYVVRRDWFTIQNKFVTEETVGYVMPRDRSIDVDNEIDFLMAEAIIAAQRTDNISASQRGAA